MICVIKDEFKRDFISNYFKNMHCMLNGHNAKHVRKNINKELIPAAWYPTKWWDWCMPGDEKKRNRTNFC